MIRVDQHSVIVATPLGLRLVTLPTPADLGEERQVAERGVGFPAPRSVGGAS